MNEVRIYKTMGNNGVQELSWTWTWFQKLSEFIDRKLIFFCHWDGRVLMKLKSNPASCAMPSPIECAFATLYPWQQVDKLTKIHKYVAGAACLLQTYIRSVGLKNPPRKWTDHIGPLHVVPLGFPNQHAMEASAQSFVSFQPQPSNSKPGSFQHLMRTCFQ